MSMVERFMLESPAAPAAPPKEAPTKPNTTPKSPPKPSPWNPPLPSTYPMPKPKARERSQLRETFERSVHPSSSQFWSKLPQNKKHIFGKHPIFALHGLDKAKRSWQAGVDGLKKLYPDLTNIPNPQLMQRIRELVTRAFRDIMHIERPHAKQLENLAVDLVHKTWNVPKKLLLAKLSKPTHLGQDGDDEPDDHEDTADDIADYDLESYRDLINKRLTLNTMTQGAAVHNMYTIHHMAAERLREISPELLDLYSKFAVGANTQYWLIDFAALANLANFAGGGVKLSRDGDEIKINAQAMIFPVLVQELVKGVMELLTLHGMSDLDEQQYETVMRHADKLEYEPWQIQVGTELWKAFLKIIPRGFPIHEIIPILSRQSPKFIHDLLSDTLDDIRSNRDPENARRVLSNMVNELREEDQY